MSKRCGLVIFGLWAVVLVVGLAVRHGSMAETLPHPAIETERNLQLGRQELYTTVEPSVVVRNNGRQSLLIKDITTTCGCLGVFVQNGSSGRQRIDSLAIAPKGTAKLIMPFTIGGNPGLSMIHEVRFATNDPLNPTVKLSIGLTPIARYFAVPGSVVLGTVPVGSSVGNEGEIRAFDRQLPGIAQVISSNERIRAAFQPVFPLADLVPGDDPSVIIGRLQISLETPTTEAEISGVISVFCEGRPDPVIKVPITARVRRVVELVPRELTLPRQSGLGPIYTAACICRAPAAKSFSLVVEQAPSDFDVRIKDLPENPRLKFVEIDATRLKDKIGAAGLVTRVTFIAEADGKRIPLALTLSIRPVKMPVKEAMP